MLRQNTARVVGVPMKSINTNINSNTSSSGSPIDALPKQFVVSMKKLFDILDDQHTGLVRFSDIEKGWQDDGCKGLPRGVIDSLRKVTPANGLLSFERFCAGLKLCLLRNQCNHPPPPPVRRPSAPTLDIENPLPTTPWTDGNQEFTRRQRTTSMPQLSPDSEFESDDLSRPPMPVKSKFGKNAVQGCKSPAITPLAVPPLNYHAELKNANMLKQQPLISILPMSETAAQSYSENMPPPKPPRALVAPGNPNILSPMGSSTNTPMDKAEIRQTLQNWQMGILLNEMDEKDKHHKLNYFHQQQIYRGSADGGSSSATDSVNGTMTLNTKKPTSKRREPRRHTLQNGIDYNMLKRLKQLEEERELLLLGLDGVDRARDWYLQQLESVQDKIKYLGRVGHVEQWSEVQQERLNFQRTRVLEINRSLSMMTDTWESGGFPLHFNLAITTTPANETLCHNAPYDNGAMLHPNDQFQHSNRHNINVKGNHLKNERRLFHVNGLTNHHSSNRLGDADVVY